ncbi:MAG: pyrroline-5-carboxylate reductase [Flavobacteriales bacterium]|nr:pyrroline-5-carboxylate reductase [Flavobacteriales bacterium]
MRILVIGGGNMGFTYAEGMSKSELSGHHKIMICDAMPQRVAELKEYPEFEVYSEVEECITQADVVFLAVKPFHAEEVFEKIKPLVSPDQIFVSLMAGVNIFTIQKGTGSQKVVRTMPNLPAKVGLGVTSYVAAREVSRIELLTIRSLLDTTGESIHVDNEQQIDYSTGISGSGPAYVFYFMNSMLEAAIQMGFSEHDAKVLVRGTFRGAVELFDRENTSLHTWMDRVASKGGTTRAALDSMEASKVKDAIKEAAFAAFHRAVELGLGK